MEPVMKIVDSAGITHYIFHPERVFQIHDQGKPDKPVATMYFDGPSREDHIRFTIDGVTARDLKRSIQENVPDKIGFLKLDFLTERFGKGARRYINVDHIVSVNAARIWKTIDGQSVQVGGAHVHGIDFAVVVEGAPFAIAAQIRRVLKRLDQDEDFCCEEPPAEEAESE